MSILNTTDIKNIVETICSEINVLAAQEHLTHAKQCVEIGVNEFYGTYDPKLYGRTGGLKTFAKPEIVGNEDFVFQFGPEYGQGSYSVGLEYIFIKIFMLGWHGGADSGLGHPASGIPYYRTPYPYYNRWGRQAIKSPTSPYQNIINHWNAYCQNEWPSIKQQIIDNVIKKYWDKIEKYLTLEQLNNVRIEIITDIE